MSSRAARRWAGVCIGCGAALALIAMTRTPLVGYEGGAGLVGIGSYAALCCLVFLWGQEIYGGRGAFAATALIAFLPLLLASVAAAGAVVAATCLTLATVYALGRCLLDPSVQAAVIAGLAQGAALLAGGRTMPLFGIGIVLVLVRVVLAERHESRRRVLHGGIVSLAIAGGIAFVILGAGGRVAAAYVGAPSVLGHQGMGVAQQSLTAVFLKIPLPFVVLVLMRPWRRHRRYSDLALSVPAVWWLLAPDRYTLGAALPAFPFLALLAAASWEDRRSRPLRLAASGLGAALALVALATCRDYGSYTNVLGKLLQAMTTE